MEKAKEYEQLEKDNAVLNKRLLALEDIADAAEQSSQHIRELSILRQEHDSLREESATLSDVVHELRCDLETSKSQNKSLHEELSRSQNQLKESQTSLEHPTHPNSIIHRQKSEILKLNRLIEDERRTREEDVRSITSDFEIHVEAAEGRETELQARLVKSEEERHALMSLHQGCMKEKDEVALELSNITHQLETAHQDLAAARSANQLFEVIFPSVDAYVAQFVLC